MAGDLRLPPLPEAHPPAEPVTESPLPALVRAESANFPAHATVVLLPARSIWGCCSRGYCLPARGARRPLARTALELGRAGAVRARGMALVRAGRVSARRHRGDGGTDRAVPGQQLCTARARCGPVFQSQRRTAPGVPAVPSRCCTRRARRNARATRRTGCSARDHGRYLEPRDRRRYVLHALEGEDVIAFHLEASVHDDDHGPAARAGQRQRADAGRPVAGVRRPCLRARVRCSRCASRAPVEPARSTASRWARHPGAACCTVAARGSGARCWRRNGSCSSAGREGRAKADIPARATACW